MLLLAHLPHLALALFAAGIVVRVEAGGARPRRSRVGLVVALASVVATTALALPVLGGQEPGSTVVVAYLAAGLMAAGRTGWCALRALPEGARARLGRLGRASVGASVTVMVAGAFLVSGASLGYGLACPGLT